MIKEGKRTILIRKFCSAIFIAAFLFLAITQNAISAVPHILSFQGRLTDGSGNLLGNTGTNYYFKFAIYDSLSGINQLWSSGASAITLKVTQGVFNTLLGDTTAGFNALDLDFDSSTDYYLQVQVSSDNASFETLAPRQRIVSSGFAVNADTVHGGRFLNATGVGQFGGLATVAYSRFGSAITSHALTTSSDLLLSNILEVNGNAFFDSSASVSVNFEVSGFASASQTFGSGLSACSDPSGAKLLWSAVTGKFSCGVDQTTAGLGHKLTIKEGGVRIQTDAASLSFDPSHFNLTASGSYDVAIKLDWVNGPASRSIAQSITGLWTFVNGASISTNLEVGGYASIGGNVLTRGTGSSSFAGSLNISKGLTANSYQGGGLTLCTSAGNVLRFSQGQFSCATLADADIPDDITLTRYLDSDIPLITIGNTGSSSFERALTGTANQITVTDGGANGAVTLSIPSVFAITAASLSSNIEIGGYASIGGNATVKGALTVTGVTTLTGGTTGTLTIAGSGAGITFNGGGTNTIQSSGGTLTINAFTLGGDITGASKNITGLTLLTSTQASHSASLEIGTYASIGGNVLARGTGSSSFAGSINISKGLTANSIQGAGLTTCG
ncbi:hypothetical protein KW791_01130, partial [Candidatus Parcubacteria bacterium]|nr:hypothetical protein [Candidatus Parcubacteria bacterium]